MITREQITAQPGSIIELTFVELLAERDEVIAENRQLRERIDELEDELTRKDQEVTRREEERDRYKSLIDWSRDLFANKTIPQACKLVLWYFHFIFFCMRPTTTGEEMRIGVEATAEALGVSKGTVRRATDKAEKFDILKRRYEDIKMDDGGKITLAHITLSDVVVTPQGIVMEKEHGGVRVKKCQKCGSEDVDRYTVQYCRCCNQNDWYFQPTTRDDAPWQLAQKAENRLPFGKGQKQDAFESSELEATEIDAQHSAEPAVQRNSQINETPVKSSQKQDALEISDDQARHILPSQTGAHEQLDAEQSKTEESVKLLTEHLEIQERVVVCTARILINKVGEDAKGLEKCVGSRECGSTRWQWSEVDHGPVCAECWTPMPQRLRAGSEQAGGEGR